MLQWVQEKAIALGDGPFWRVYHMAQSRHS